MCERTSELRDFSLKEDCPDRPTKLSVAWLLNVPNRNLDDFVRKNRNVEDRPKKDMAAYAGIPAIERSRDEREFGWRDKSTAAGGAVRVDFLQVCGAIS